MANEITVTQGLKVTKSSLRVVRNTLTTRANMTGTKKIENAQTVGTTHEALLLGDTTATGGWMIATNCDTTNYVEIGVDVGGTFYPAVKLLAGETAGPFRCGTSAPYARANTAAVVMDYSIIEA